MLGPEEGHLAGLERVRGYLEGRIPELICEGYKVEKDISGRAPEGTAGACVCACETSSRSLLPKHEVHGGGRSHLKEGPAYSGGLDAPGCYLSCPTPPMLVRNHKSQTQRGVLHDPGMNCYSHHPLK